MQQGWIDPAVRDLRPDYVATLIVATGLSPGPSDAQSEAVLADAERRAAALLAGRAPEDLAPVAQWREAYRDFGAKPQRTRPSVEALLRRVGDGLPRIDRLTDVYNAISIGHVLPIGGEDFDHYVGAPRLVRAAGDEPFETTRDGEPAVEHPDPGEVVWRDDLGVTCRRWNWRQCTRTRLTGETTCALFVLDGLSESGADGVANAALELIDVLGRLSPGAEFQSYSPTVSSTRSG